MGYTRIYDGSTCLKRAVDFHCHESGPQIKEGTVCSRDGASQRHTTAPPPPPSEADKEVLRNSCQTASRLCGRRGCHLHHPQRRLGFAKTFTRVTALSSVCFPTGACKTTFDLFPSHHFKCAFETSSYTRFTRP